MAGDNATAEELARRCRAELIARDEVDRDGARIATGIASYGDEVVTLQNDRRLRTSTGEFVRNGTRWQVVGTMPNGVMLVRSLDDGGAVTLPPDYVREHVALGYALTVHKAQGQTVERAVVLVDEKMTAAQLYVAMSRGREENRALVISSDDAPEDHVLKPLLDTSEVLGRVMRRAEVDHSAHDVMRRNLSRFDDVALLSDLYEEAYAQITRSIGADRSKEIAALEPRADVQGAANELRAADDAIRRATEDRAEAEARLCEAEQEPIRARLPGRMGEASRYRAAGDRGRAGSALYEAKRDEQNALRAREAARSHLIDAEQAAGELAALRTEQARRDGWLRDHADEVRWADELWQWIEAKRSAAPSDRLGGRGSERPSKSRPLARRTGVDRDDVPSNEPRTTVDMSREHGEAAIVAVLARCSPTPSSPPPPEREGPSLGR